MKRCESPSEISIARQYSRWPAGRLRSDGDFSGERFRLDMLLPALQQHTAVIVDLDGTLGLSTSFLEEVFGVLASEAPDLLNRLQIKTEDPVVRGLVEQLIFSGREAPSEVLQQNPVKSTPLAVLRFRGAISGTDPYDAFMIGVCVLLALAVVLAVWIYGLPEPIAVTPQEIPACPYPCFEASP